MNWSASALVGAFALANCLSASLLRADTIVSYSFPASWDGTGTVVTDLSPAGNDGMATGAAALSAVVPPGSPAGDQSLAPSDGGILTDNTNLLENPTIAPAGGFAMHATFMWDGGEGNRTVQKIVDNEGTESLQLQNIDLANGTADLQFRLNDFGGPSMPIVANQWYEATGFFDSHGNSVDGSGNLAGTATLTVDGASTSQAMTRFSGDTGGMGTASDTLDRPIALGVLALPAAPTVVDFSGFIYNASVELVPEPTAIGLLVCGVVATAATRRRRALAG